MAAEPRFAPAGGGGSVGSPAPAWVLAVMAGMLLWPAVWNGYPIVFADTGTYLSQAVHRYLGWDRPPFYSIFMLPLHWTLTTWPVVVAQAVLTSWVLALVWRVLAPLRSARWLIPGTALLALGTWLPWLVSELMPDVFTPVLVLTFCLLAFAPDRLARWERMVLVPLAGFMIAAQQSSVAVWCGLLVGVGVWQGGRWWLSPDLWRDRVGRLSSGDKDNAPTPPLPLRAWAAKRTEVGGRGGVRLLATLFRGRRLLLPPSSLPSRPSAP